MLFEDPKTTHPPDIVGGRLCLDLANTLPHEEKGSDRIADYPQFLTWTAETGITTVAEAEALRRRAEADPRACEVALNSAREVRKWICNLFGAIADGGEPDPQDLNALNEALRVVRVRAELAPARVDGYEWRWRETEGNLLRPLWPVVLSAAELLASDELPSIRRCDSDRCRWLFVDRSRNGSRRWCDMRVCGNRAKVRRHYTRKKADHANADR
ncbi:MAG: ABATE domain-containing protein [Candidatus Latescibacterota bacterium]|nr:ABATE domain-containing protein [Candidatus Latescibacterota bacterium]